MSELKVHRFITTDELFPEANAGVLYYEKSEADKVIADLEESHKMEVGQLLMEIAELQKQVHDYAQGLYVIQAKAEEEARHDKYKRCLAMAKYCENALLGWMGHKESFSSYQRYNKVMLFTKWHKRWIKIAEQFKEAK